jgi:regulator of sigma E protease
MCHELGHFLLAKLFGMKVEEFAFGFGRALWARQRGETTYRLNLIPYGAYVKIAGMEPGAPLEERGFHARPRWQGALVILGGSFANLLLAIVLFAVVTFWSGVPVPEDRGVYISRVTAGSPAAAAGVLVGDEIIGVDGARRSLEISTVAPGSLGARLGLRPGLFIERVNATEVFVPTELAAALRKCRESKATLAVLDYNVAQIDKQQRLVTLSIPPALRRGTAGTAEQALRREFGLTFGAISQVSLVGYIANRPSQPVTLTVKRGDGTHDLAAMTTVTHARYALRDDRGMVYSRIRSVGRIGVVLRAATRPVGVGEAVGLGALKSISGAATVILSVRAMLRREVEAELAGPVAIMAISAERAKIGWDAVLNWGGVISSILAVMNLFPIPPFDGFRILLLGWEAVIRRRIEPQKELVLSIAGFIVIVFLFMVLTFKDIFNLVQYGTP